MNRRGFWKRVAVMGGVVVASPGLLGADSGKGGGVKECVGVTCWRCGKPILAGEAVEKQGGPHMGCMVKYYIPPEK